MRLDKFLKVSRIVKRRTVANEMATAGRINVNGKRAKSGTKIAVGDIIEIGFGERKTKIKVKAIRPAVKKEEAESLYELIG